MADDSVAQDESVAIAQQFNAADWEALRSAENDP